jgi:hypothetical protein
MSQTPEIQDSATLRERDETINLVEMGGSRTPYPTDESEEELDLSPLLTRPF